jgi:hypothetical protein
MTRNPGQCPSVAAAGTQAREKGVPERIEHERAHSTSLESLQMLFPYCSVIRMPSSSLGWEHPPGFSFIGFHPERFKHATDPRRKGELALYWKAEIYVAFKDRQGGEQPWFWCTRTSLRSTKQRIQTTKKPPGLGKFANTTCFFPSGTGVVQLS